MSNQITTSDQSLIERLVLDGDLSKMQPMQKVQYYNEFCQSLGLNPLTQPFQIIRFQGKEKLYATKDCTEQLRKIHGVSITDISAQNISGVFVVTAKATDINGKTDASTGAVPIDGLKGDALANALMKAETKAKRRVTLSICGLGLLDESETDTMKGAVTMDVPHEEIKPTKTTAYNHKVIEQDGKPLITNEAFKKLLERLNSGETEVYQKAVDSFSFEDKQRGILDASFEIQNISDEDLDNWQAVINSAQTIDELRKIKTKHSPFITQNFKTFTMLSNRKAALEAQTIAA